MGKQASKHVRHTKEPPDQAECFLVNARLNKALEEQILKQTKTTGFNLANYNMNNSISELSISVEDKQDNSTMPLRVELPPHKMDSDATKILVFDQDELEKKTITKDENNMDSESKLNIEEFECGVEFGGTENNKQEWSFTLYDFDGHGKITKEDLASLLKALYDAVGSSIKIPANGTKTLKLRLTVGQDGSQLPGCKTSPLKVKDSVKDKCKDTFKSKESPKSKEFAKLNNLTRTHVQIPVKCTNEGQQGVTVSQGVNQCQGHTGSNQCQGHTGSNQCQIQSCNKRIQLTTQEQQELVELVQENMERNHIKQLRRHHSDCRGNGHEHSHHKRRHRNHGMKSENSAAKNNNNVTISETPQNNHDDRAKESQDRRNYYLDLAGIEHNAISKCQSFTNNPIGKGHNSSHHHHQRSRSHENNQKCDNITKESECLNKQLIDSVKADHIRSRSFDPQEAAVRSPKGHHKSAGSSPHKHGRFRPMSLPMHIPDAVSAHYHRRHRNREKDHDLAMQQVAEWIEREHTWDVDGERVVVQRHEHHHVHEHHHHHHYHHYYEA